MTSKIGTRQVMSRKMAEAYFRVFGGMNYRLRTIAGGRWASLCKPINIAILLTELCNARCVHCDIWKNRGKEDSPTEEQWKTVLSDIRRWLGPVQVTFTGGEALLKQFATDLVAHSSSIGLLPELLTHGYWDDQSRIEKLAQARPWRVTISLDGVGETHTQIRGREKFFEKTATTIQTLQRVRKEDGLDFMIRLKTVIMEHNLDNLAEVARFADQDRMDVFYQPIEQNYNTPEDSRWYEHSTNWPTNTAKAVEAVKCLIKLKQEGLPIANSLRQLEVMIPYFENPSPVQITTRSHEAHEKTISCAALIMLQLQANGDVRVCSRTPPVGNIKTASIREIWEKRPRLWEQGCCRTRDCKMEGEEASTPSSQP